MKTKKHSQKKHSEAENKGGIVLKEAAVAYNVDEPMVRTQIYLSKAEYDFIQQEASHQGRPMAAIIRAFIDEKMEVPAETWTGNPLLNPPAPDPEWKGREDGAINHDHYIYGSPKKWTQRDSAWTEAAPLPDDYYNKPPDTAVRYEKSGRKK